MTKQEIAERLRHWLDYEESLQQLIQVETHPERKVDLLRQQSATLDEIERLTTDARKRLFF